MLLTKLKNELKKFITQPRRRDIVARALEFAKNNPDVIILVLDPKKDDIIAAQNKHYSATRIVSKMMGFKTSAIKTAVYGKTEKERDRAINKILQVMDGFLFNLANKVNERSANQKNNKK